MNLKDIAETLNRDEVRSRVMKDGAFFDTFIGIAIGMYFTTQERFPKFYELIIERLNFDEKIRALERLPYRKPYKSALALPVIRQVQQARNFIAHEWYAHQDHHKLRKANWLSLFSNYPASYTEPVKLARQRLLRLSGTKEFLEILEK